MSFQVRVPSSLINSMFEWLKKFQEKPESVRRSVALLSAGVITLCIVLVWLAVQVFVVDEATSFREKETSNALVSPRGDWQMLRKSIEKQTVDWSGFWDVLKRFSGSEE